MKNTVLRWFLGGLAGLVSGCTVVDQQAVPVLEAGRPLAQSTSVDQSAGGAGVAISSPEPAPVAQVMVPEDALPALQVLEVQSTEQDKSKAGF